MRAAACAEPVAEPAPSPYAGAPDLNDDRAIETSGVLFMEGEGEPAEISRIKAELLADLLGERHRIIGNNWQNASTAQLVARYLRRAVTVMERIDFSPAALRQDLAGPRSAVGYLYAVAELVSHAADLSAASSVLIHEDGRRWRMFRERVEQITAPIHPG